MNRSRGGRGNRGGFRGGGGGRGSVNRGGIAKDHDALENEGADVDDAVLEDEFNPHGKLKSLFFS